MDIQKILIGLTALLVAGTSVAAATEYGGTASSSTDSSYMDSSSSTSDLDFSTNELLSDTAATDEGGKPMAQIVDEAKKGFPTNFSDEEVMTLMKASHVVKESDRGLSRKVEKIASKMSRFYVDKT